MAEVVESVRIERSSADVWAVLADFAGISRWAGNVDHSSMTTAQAEGPGATRRVQVGRNALLETVTHWDDGSSLAYEIAGLPPVVRSATNTWSLEAVADDATEVRLTSRIDAGPRPPQQLVARGLARVLVKTSREMLAGLKRHLEEIS